MAAEPLRKSFDWHNPHARQVRPVPRFTLHLRCMACARGYYASAPLILPPCPACQRRTLVTCCVWDLTRSASPPCWSAGDEGQP